MANRFEVEIADSCSVLGWWHVKLVTASSPSKKSRFMKTTPFDFAMMIGKQSLCAEAKSTKILSSFPFDRVKPHQIAGLLDHKAHSGSAWILLNFRKPKNIAYAIDINDWIALEATVDRKSVASKEFEKTPFISIPRVRVKYTDSETLEEDVKLIWDLRELLNKKNISKNKTKGRK